MTRVGRAMRIAIPRVRRVACARAAARGRAVGSVRARRALLALPSLATQLALLALLAVPAAALASGRGHGSPATVAVPYVAQSGNLCGGAALAMVLRHWGVRQVHAEDFAALVNQAKGGIETSVLQQAAGVNGFEGVSFRGTIDTVAEHLSHERPVIVLLGRSRVRFHYVVVIGIDGGRVTVHDPAIGPDQKIERARFDRRWSASGRWALVVTPRRDLDTGDPDLPITSTAAPASGSPGPPVLSPCSALVARAVADAHSGALVSAERQLADAIARCPGEPAPLRELAGLKLVQRNWSEARAFSARAVTLDPDDIHAWNLLASSQYLQGDRRGALTTWNVVNRPGVDLVQVDGLERLPYRIAADAIALPPGAVLTERRLRLARRRLAEIPALEGAALTWVPSSTGVADVRASVAVRPVIDRSSLSLARIGIRAAFDREIEARLSNPLGAGEAWTARWRWWPERPRVGLALAVPRPSGLPGIWTVAGQWEREAYARGRTARSPVVREERRHGSVRVEDWWHPSLLLGIRAGFDRWDARDMNYSLGGGPELRLFDDRGAARLDGEWWLAGPRFSRLALDTSWRPTHAATSRHQAHVRLGAQIASREAPLGLWPGAGSTQSRGALLRAHPLLEDDVVSGEGFGREIVHATIEGQRWHPLGGGVRLGAAAFVDAARVQGRDGSPRPSVLVDAGLGVRIGLAGRDTHVRVDVARSLTDGTVALSAGWVAPWPGW
jgi:predicted double-glycine peptidase